MAELFKVTSETNRKIKIGLAVVAFLAILALVFFAGRSYQKQIPSESEKYLQEQVEIYQKEIEDWKARFTSVSTEKQRLEKSVETLEAQVNSIRNYYDKKVIAVKSYSNPELEQFFADRYPD